ncbi:uncharacterized protein LOC106403019 isoform X2 [Brassica napus]|uniref:uncharacterized protein LOC106403019 isoform X2 n=1 Tax=Brassica napus TaxID=3708 RepID=UPI00207A6D6C|nr:uncharacterized protein LOC106403019 isoform X2 [Brassica napus]
MSSNGEKGMMKRSDFAQKLLDDLRVRKERLSISQDTDNYAYSNRGFKGSKKTRSKSTTFQDFNYGGANLLTSGTEDSNQILPYGKGRSIDLSKALAFALENAGKATRADPSGNASIISFLHEVGKRSLGRSSQQHLCSSSQQQLPMVHVHIKEISKGAQKLNQIIRACSNGLSFRKGRYSIQCGREEHMEGAIELEQSLRLLVDIQQASSEYITKKQSQNRFKLLEENEDGEEEEDVWNRNNRKIKEAAKTDIEMRLLALKNKHRRQASGCEDTEHKPQKGRIPNVVAKLMGIGEFPEEEKKTKNNNDASIKSAESLTRRRATQSNEKIVELKDQRNSTSLDLVLHKETQRTTNGINYKDKSQQKDDPNCRKGNKKDGEMTMKNAIRKTSSPTEDKPKAVTRSQEKPLHQLSFGKKEEAKSIKKAKLKPERHQEHGVMTNHPPKPVSSVPVIDKAKSLRKSFSHVVVLEKKKGGEVHEAEFREKKNLNGGFCKVMKQPENQKPVSREANGKQDQLLRSYNDSNKTKAVEADNCINISEDSGIEVKSSNRNVFEKKKDIKDDSILLIAAERVLCQAPSENHQELIFTDGVDQQAPVSNSDGNSERFSKTVYKVVSASKGEVEAGIPLLEKRQEHRKQETKETLSENEMNLKKIVVKSQLFLDTFEALFKLNIPLNVLHEVGGNNYHQEDKNLLLDCGFEIMKRKGRFQELKVHPFVKVPISSSKVNSLDHLVRQLSKEFEKLRTYGRECYTESLVEDYLPKVLKRDVYYTDPNLNSMWDMGWNDSMDAFIEKDDVIRDVEREVFNGLLEEITRDLICI